MSKIGHDTNKGFIASVVNMENVMGGAIEISNLDQKIRLKIGETYHPVDPYDLYDLWEAMRVAKHKLATRVERLTKAMGMLDYMATTKEDGGEKQ